LSGWLVAELKIRVLLKNLNQMIFYWTLLGLGFWQLNPILKSPTWCILVVFQLLE